ncbi:MAG: hypothetical protein V4662_08840 [Verrucomicrobiota bacterium]
MRSVFYWLTCSIVAVVCIKAAATPSMDQTAMTAAVPTDLLNTTQDPVRAMVLGIGIMAVAYTYRRVWQNFGFAREE